MKASGVVTPSGIREAVVRLNVGGLPVTVGLSVLLDGVWGSHGGGLLHSLLNVAWDKRLPRDADGRIVLDESTGCMKVILHALFRSPAERETVANILSSLPHDEKSYLPHVTSAIRLWDCANVEGGSTVLNPEPLGPLSSTILSWCPDKPTELELLYRGSRDGMNADAFHSRCKDDKASTVVLLKLQPYLGCYTCCVVGGYSNIPWAPAGRFVRDFGRSEEAFVFMLTNETDNERAGGFTPSRYRMKRGRAHLAIQRKGHEGPHFGKGDLSVKFHAGRCVLYTKPCVFDIPEHSLFKHLDGKTITDIEVFRVGRDAKTMFSDDDNEGCNFGELIAGSFVEERMALLGARREFSQAEAAAAASVHALKTAYGPHIAAGEGYKVIELSVRGTPMTTFLSTLQACPESALAAQFNERRWPATPRDVDKHRRRLIDCSPAVFSKILDVLRVRKRAAWASGKKSWKDPGRSETAFVTVRTEDQASFTEFVNMYFVGCESFDMDRTVPFASTVSSCGA